MFGNDNNQQNDTNAPFSMPPVGGPSAPGADITPPPTETPAPAQDVSLPSTPPSSLPGGFTPPKPLNDVTASPSDETSAPSVPNPVPSDSDEEEQPLSSPEPVDLPEVHDDDEESGALTASPNDLVRIKQDALQKLSPLVDHLDQTPEERFRTTMMMIQATDDSSKIKAAYEVAQQITDEKVKAQALLDIVNEINYFTQQQKEAEDS